MWASSVQLVSNVGTEVDPGFSLCISHKSMVAKGAQTTSTEPRRIAKYPTVGGIFKICQPNKVMVTNVDALKCHVH